MINKVAKGRRVENKAQKLLENDGYLVDKKNRSKFQSPDLFGEFDLLAIGKDVKLIQIKSNMSGFYTARKKIASFYHTFRILNDRLFPSCLSLECWCYLGNNEWRKDKLVFNSYEYRFEWTTFS